MRVLQIVSLALGLASSVIAASTKDRYVRRSNSMQYSSAEVARRSQNPVNRIINNTLAGPSPFAVTDLYTRQAVDKATSALYLDSVSFVFTDPNSNSSASCTYDWQASSTNSSTYFLTTGPGTWQACEFAGDGHYFYYEFYSYTSVIDFELGLLHEFYDTPAAAERSYESVATHIALLCEDVDSADGCYEASYPAPQYFPITN